MRMGIWCAIINAYESNYWGAIQLLAIGSDHAGYPLKKHLLSFLQSNGFTFKDVGSVGGEAVDYPLAAKAVASLVLDGTCEMGILICGTGIGISIAANKIPGIRCALCADPYSAKMARAHNNANIIALGGRVIGPNLAEEILSAFLNGSFEGGRHQTRLDMIEKG